MARIDDLLEEIPDTALRAHLEREVTRLRKATRFGLMFERHWPETAILTGVDVVPGDMVRRRSEANTEQTWRASTVLGDKVEMTSPDGGRTDVATAAELCDHPTETQPSDWTMLRDAAEQWEYFRIAWDDYTAKEHDPPVDPILVVQVDDASAKARLQDGYREGDRHHRADLRAAARRRVRPLLPGGDADPSWQPLVALHPCIRHPERPDGQDRLFQALADHRLGLPARRSNDELPSSRRSHVHRPTRWAHGAHPARAHRRAQ
ncbi:MAG TPA: hypothetical protein VGO80_07045 [Solirubrobacteraceae bacterium]|jgi:hypothetical protein|nr:hypothetical protein [Solirubrobacteraceae bacterium]